MQPKLSIIIATYNRAESLARTLASIISMAGDASDWECIVVNNNSTDDTAAVFNRVAKENTDVALRIVDEPVQGLSSARNCGIRNAKGRVVVFIDDDETVEKVFAVSYMRFFDEHPEALVAGGAVVPVYETGCPRWMSEYVERMIANPMDFGSVVRPFPRGRIPAGGNMAFRREVFERYDSFNPRLGRNGKQLTGGEESDLFVRLRGEGVAFFFVPNAAIYHHIPASKLTIDYVCRLGYGVGRSKACRAETAGQRVAIVLSEIMKWAVVILLSIGYTLALHPSKVRPLVAMRSGISRGILSR